MPAHYDASHMAALESYGQSPIETKSPVPLTSQAVLSRLSVQGRCQTSTGPPMQVEGSHENEKSS